MANLNILPKNALFGAACVEQSADLSQKGEITQVQKLCRRLKEIISETRITKEQMKASNKLIMAREVISGIQTR